MKPSRSVESDGDYSRLVLSMRVKISVVGLCFVLTMSFLVYSNVPYAIEALRGLAQGEDLVENESQVSEPGSWPMFKGNPRRTGYAQGAAPHTNETTWIFQAEDSITKNNPRVVGSPIVVNDILFVQLGAWIYALDKYSGEPIWKKNPGGHYPYYPLAASNDMIYVVISNRGLYAWNQSNGNQIWGAKISASLFSAAYPVISDGVIFTAWTSSNSEIISALNQQTGEILWNYSAGMKSEGEFLASLAVNDDLVFVSGFLNSTTQEAGYYIFSLNRSNGELIWKYPAPNLTGDTSLERIVPTFAYGLVFVRSGEYELVALNKTTGELVWCNENQVHPLWNTHRLEYMSSPTVGNGKLFIGCRTGPSQCAAFDALTGELLWINDDSSGYRDNNPIMADGLVYICGREYPPEFRYPIGSNEMYPCFYALNQSSGELVWKYKLAEPGVLWGSPAIADGFVFVGTDKGIMYAFGQSDVTPKQGISSEDLASEPWQDIYIGDDGVYFWQGMATILPEKDGPYVLIDDIHLGRGFDECPVCESYMPPDGNSCISCGLTTQNGILVEADNIMINGAGYTIFGYEECGQLEIIGRNVTLKNLNIIQAGYNSPIVIKDTENCVLTNITISYIGDYPRAEGISLRYTNNVTLRNVEVKNFGYGILLSNNCNNTLLADNTVSNCSNGINIIGDCLSTVIQNNNFIYNQQNVHGGDYIAWDQATFDGNYWHSYAGQDSDHDGVGDTPFIITVEGQEVGQDNHPLMKPWTDITEPNLLELLSILGLILVQYSYAEKSLGIQPGIYVPVNSQLTAELR